MKTINIAALMMAAVTTIVTNPAQAQDVRELLTDRTSEQVQEYRKDLNEHDMLHEVQEKGMFKDHVLAYDGNVVEPWDLCTKYQATQGFSLGIVATGYYFAGNFLPAVGAGLQYGYRRWTARAEFTLGKGEYDKTADKTNSFLEENFRGEFQYAVWGWREHHHQLGLLAGLSFKLRKDYHDLSKLGEEEVTDLEGHIAYNGRTFGAYGGAVYTFAPKFSSWSMFVKATAGASQNYKGNITGLVETDEYTEISFGSKKWYPEVTVSVGVNFNVFNKKHYNTKAMRALGYSKADVKRLSKGR